MSKVPNPPNLLGAKPRAFTLVELLVCVGLIAALALLVSSSLITTRKSALTTRCVNNLRQLGVAISAYASEHQGRLNLYAEKPGNSTTIDWSRYLTGRVDADHNRSTKGKVYLENTDLFVCPSIAPFRYSDGIAYIYGTATRNTADPYSIAPPGTDASSREVILSRIDRPSDYWLLADSYQPSRNAQLYLISPTLKSAYGAHLRHAGRVNVLFADGHVEAALPERMKNLPITPITAGYDGQQKEIKF